MLTHRALLMWLGILVATVPSLRAEPAVDPCAPAAQACAPAPQYVEKTILCPTLVTEDRVVTVTECRAETRTYACTVYKTVPETKQVQRKCTVMVPEVRTRTEQYTACRPVWKEETRQYTVMVPHMETRQGTRRVCRMVPVKETRMVCEDQGHWEERARDAAPGPCEPCRPVRTCRCWVPKIVQKPVEVTCMRREIVEEPCTYRVTVCRPETRTCKVRVCHYEQVPATRTVCYSVCVPQTKTWTENVTCCRRVPVQETRQCTVMVPHQVQKTVKVQVCKMVPKTVKVPVCPPAPCCEVRIRGLLCRHHGCGC